MNIFKKKSYFSVSGTEEKKKTEKNKKSQEPSIPDGMWIKCNTCKNIIYKKEVTEFKLCPNCGAHFRMSPAERIKIICDEGSFKELDADMLIILTAVEKVAVNFGKENEKWLDEMTVAEAQ